jgi:hypothetical protein
VVGSRAETSRGARELSARSCRRLSPQPVDATACEVAASTGGHRFGGFGGWPGEAGLGLGDHGRSFGGAPWPGGFVGCPGLEPPLLGSDMYTSVGSPDSTIPLQPETSARIYSRRPSQVFRLAHPKASAS